MKVTRRLRLSDLVKTITEQGVFSFSFSSSDKRTLIRTFLLFSLFKNIISILEFYHFEGHSRDFPCVNPHPQAVRIGIVDATIRCSLYLWTVYQRSFGICQYSHKFAFLVVARTVTSRIGIAVLPECSSCPCPLLFFCLVNRKIVVKFDDILFSVIFNQSQNRQQKLS